MSNKKLDLLALQYEFHAYYLRHSQNSFMTIISLMDKPDSKWMSNYYRSRSITLINHNYNMIFQENAKT